MNRRAGCPNSAMPGSRSLWCKENATPSGPPRSSAKRSPPRPFPTSSCSRRWAQITPYARASTRQWSPLGWRASYHEGMPSRARARSRKSSGPTALTDADVALLRERLETGKRPRVMLLVDTALGAAGTSVPVVGFADPAVGEFISIRLRDDVVPFSPAELSLPVRGAKATPAAAAPAALPLEPAGAPARPSHPSEGYRPSGADAHAASKRRRRPLSRVRLASLPYPSPRPPSRLSPRALRSPRRLPQRRSPPAPAP